MKIKTFLKTVMFSFLVVFVLGMCLTSCDDGSSTPIENEPGINQGDNQDSNKEPDKDENQDTNPSKVSGFSFNMSSIAGLAVSENTYESRNGIYPRSGGDEKLLKIKEDGSIEKFMNVPANCNLSDVSYVTKSPVEGSNEIYIIFSNNSYWYEESYDKDGYWQSSKEYRLGKFLCVFEDGTYHDILTTDKDSSIKAKWENNEYIYQMNFDNRGNVYYIANENTGSSWTDVIYKFNPRTKTSEKLVAAVSDTTYEEFYVSNSGDWLFVKGYRSGDVSANFLRAIPVSDPDNPSNLWYQSNGGVSVSQWIYNEETREVYFILDSKLYRIPYRKGGYNSENRELVGGNTSNDSSSTDYFEAEDILRYSYDNNSGSWYYKYSLAGRGSAYDFDATDWSSKYYYFIDSVTSKIDYEAIVNYLFAELLDYLKTKGDYTNGNFKFFNYRDEYEIRFDEFANIEGFEKLATETRDKYGNQLADEELFEVIIERDLLQLLANAINSDRYQKQNIYNAYDNNFFADIFYRKDSDIKIDPNLFNWEMAGGFDSYVYYFSVEFLQSSSNYDYIWKDEFFDDTGNVDATKVLAKFAEACGRNTIDFSLECFKDDNNYSVLYTDLRNEEAIKFLDADPKRMSRLREAIDDGYYYSEFLSKTCFIPETDKSAIVVGDNNTGINWDYLRKLNFANNALYAVDESSNKIVQLTDSDGVGVCEYVILDYDETLKISSITVYDNVFYFRNSIINSIGEETGCHTILKFDPELSEIEDMMWDVPNSENYEITSYSIVGNDLYPCMVRGTNIIIGRIDLSTRFYEKFSDTNAELKQLLMLK